MKSGNWFGNWFTFCWGLYGMIFWALVGGFLGIFGAWQVGIDGAMQVIADFPLPDVTKDGAYAEEMYVVPMKK